MKWGSEAPGGAVKRSAAPLGPLFCSVVASPQYLISLLPPIIGPGPLHTTPVFWIYPFLTAVVTFSLIGSCQDDCPSLTCHLELQPVAPKQANDDSDQVSNTCSSYPLKEEKSPFWITTWGLCKACLKSVFNVDSSSKPKAHVLMVSRNTAISLRLQSRATADLIFIFLGEEHPTKSKQRIVGLE